MDPLNPDPTASTKKGFLDWQLERYYDTGVVLSRRPPSCIADLLQNCDLPPPLNIFSPIQKHDDDSRVDNNKKSNPLQLPDTSPAKQPPPPPAPAKDEQWDHGADDATLLRALQLSQTRARKAERKAAIEIMRSEQMGGLLVEESLMLSVHRRWVQVLENEISMLHKHKHKHMHMHMQMPKTEEEADEVAVPAATATAAWCLAVALCLGFVLGRCKF